VSLLTEASAAISSPGHYLIAKIYLEMSEKTPLGGAETTQL
jgi:hypothetical protein